MPKHHKAIPVQISPSKGIDKLLLFHSFIGLILLLSYFFFGLSITAIGFIVLMYYLMFTWIFIFAHYRALEEMKNYFMWLFVAVVQFVVYKITQQSEEVKSLKQPGVFAPLKGLLVFLILYQILRQASLYFTHKEPIIDIRGEPDPTALEIVATPAIFIITVMCSLDLG